MAAKARRAGAGPAAEVAAVNEADARALCLLRACEEGTTDAALWSPEDAAWASRLADETAPAGAPALAWLAERARHAQQRLLPRRHGLARLFSRRIWRAGGLRWVAGAAAVGLLLGLVADMLGGSGQHINLLAAPVWAVAAWNVGAMLMLGFAALSGAGAGPLRRALQRWLGGPAAHPADGLADNGATQAAAAARNAARGAARDAARATPERRFAALWARVFASVVAARAALLLHVAALALAAGLVAGMYARALVLDYRVGWQSTLLAPAQVHGLLATVLTPASALTGLAVPGAEAVAALRHDGAGRPLSGSATASHEQTAVWLHLLAATLACIVGLPRFVLALLAAGQAARRARRLAWPVADAYALALLRQRRSVAAGAAAHLALRVLPHGFSPSPAATLALRTWLVGWGGEKLQLQWLPATAYGDEDRVPELFAASGTAVSTAVAAASPAPAAAAAAARATARTEAAPPRAPLAPCLLWFELAATPEPQVQGRFAAAVMAACGAAPVAMLVDESSYRQRLGGGSPRLAERRRAWQSLAGEAGIGLVCVDLLQAAGTAGAPGGGNVGAPGGGNMGAPGGDNMAAPGGAGEHPLDLAFAAGARGAA